MSEWADPFNALWEGCVNMSCPDIQRALADQPRPLRSSKSECLLEALLGHVDSRRLFSACQAEHEAAGVEAALQLLLERGCITTKAATKGLCAVGFAGPARVLAAAGGAVRYIDSWGKSCLHQRMSLRTLAVLLDAGADVDAADELGNTPLHCPKLYCSDGYGTGGGASVHAVVKLLLALGADASLKNGEGRTALERHRRSHDHADLPRNSVAPPAASAAGSAESAH